MTARIYSPAKSAMQSGQGKSRFWLLEYVLDQPRTIDPLMGWTSGVDMKQQIRLRFDTLEEAKAYAERNGVAYRVEETEKPPRRIQSYSDNFKPGRAQSWTH
ncbi:MAG: ETC complex I subunit [Rhodoblastus sp.]|nr:MAG: ETC complex I subunit [Rhodoblastus sp.]